MRRKSRKASRFNILGDPVSVEGRGRFSTQRKARITARGKVTQKASFRAELKIDSGYGVEVDSRKLVRDVGDEIYDALLDGLKGDYNPATGKPHPPNARITDERRELMVRTLRRTMTQSTARWGGGWYKRLHPESSTLKFYFANSKAAIINKFGARLKGKDKITRLSVKGRLDSLIERGLEKHAAKVVRGDVFGPDTTAKAWNRPR